MAVEDWDLSVRPDAAVFTTRGLMDGTKPLARIIHDADGDWQAIPAGDRNDDEAVVVCLLDIAAMSADASAALRGLDALPCGMQAVLRGTAWVYEPHTLRDQKPRIDLVTSKSQGVNGTVPSSRPRRPFAARAAPASAS